MGRYAPRGRRPKRKEIAVAKKALREIDEYRLEVVLVPAPEARHEGHMVRAVQNKNPAWYARLFESRPGGVKRKRVAKALQRVIAGYVRPNGYENEVLKLLVPERRPRNKVPF